MLDVGPSSGHGDGTTLTAFVERLAGPSPSGPAAAARRQIDTRIAGGAVPAGLRMLADALASTARDVAPLPRHPSDDLPGAIAAHSLVVLEEFGREEVAAMLGELLRDGRRVVVTAADRDRLAALTEGLAPEVVACCVDTLPALPPAEQRELRRLLATSTPARRARRHQLLPMPEQLPDPDEVARLAERAVGASRPGGGEQALLAGLLGGVEPDRLHAVTDVARRADAALAALAQTPGWSWTLLSHLVQNRHVAVFDRLVDDVTQATAAAERAQGAPRVDFVGQLPPDAGDLLRRYAEFLRGGGRNRAYFRSPAQRDVQPVLRQIRIDGAELETPEQILLALQQIELAERVVRLDAGCREIGVPPPRGPGELAALGATLARVGDAARAVASLRHDVLFIHPSSPVAVPDLASAQQVVATVLDHAAHGSVDDAERSLARMVDALAGAVPFGRSAPEHARAVDALRARDVDGYAAALDALAAARIEIGAEHRCSRLLAELATSAPRIAQAWAAAAENGATAFGLAWFVEADRVLAQLPPVDAADVVLLLGAAEVGAERLLLTAVAPRLAAVVEPGARPAAGATLLGVLQRASALVVRSRAGSESTGGRVVHLPASRSRTGTGAVRQAPA